MRLMMAMAGARHGGAERFFERLAVAFAKRGVGLRVAIRVDAERAARLRAAGIQPVELRFGGRFDVGTRRALAAAIRGFRPQVALSFMSRAAALMPRPTRAGFTHVGRLGGYYKLKYYRRCDHLVANTPEIRDYLLRSGIPEARAHYLPNFAETATTEAVDRAQLGTSADAFLLVALGRLHPNKAFDVLLAALRELPRAVLWLAGDGPLRGDLETQARHLGVADRVRFLGWRDDPRPLIAAADLVVVPSRHEPLGNVILEAWAQDRPVVAAASQGPRQLIEDGGNGVLVPVDDASALASEIAALAADPARRGALARAGRETFEVHYSEAAVVDAYLDLFERLVAERGETR